MRTVLSASIAMGLVASLALAGCSSAGSDGSTNDDSADQLSQAAKQIQGSWKNTIDSNLDSLVLLGDGTFIHDQFRVLNGVMVNNGGQNAPFGRDAGRFHASASTHTLTLVVEDGWHKGETQVFTYNYTPAPVLNGMFLPGHEPSATLTLDHQIGGGSMAIIHTEYKGIASWCSIDTDCTDELSTKTWTPAGIQPTGVAQCNTSKNTCFIGPPVQKQNACEAAGGNCVGLYPDACANGTVGDARQYSCGGGVGVECCLPPSPPPAKNPCEAAGGSCVALYPTSCANGTVGDANTYSCGGGVGVECCLPAADAGASGN